MDQVFPVIMMAMKSEQVQGLVKDEFEIDAMADEGEYSEWVGRSRLIYGEMMTNGLAVRDLTIREICRS